MPYFAALHLSFKLLPVKRSFPSPLLPFLYYIKWVPVTQGIEICICIVDMTSILSVSSVLLVLKLCSGEWCYQSQFSCQDACRVPSEWKNAFPNCGAYFTLPQSVRLLGGGLPAAYKAIQFHLHWGENSGQGSEHSVDGERYPMELHIVHIKEKYGSLGEALNDSTGVAALAFFFEVTTGQNKQLDRVIKALGKVRHEGNSSEVEDFKLGDIIPPANKLNYYRYLGSLTTPGCDQAVVWTVFQKTLPISKNQLMSMDKQLLFGTEKPMTGVFRPVQNLNGRVVYTSVPAHSLCVLPSLITLFLCLFCVFGQQRCFH
ncbi:carbonic anhydrase IV c isoform X2 [Puntigrus tetrazona]|uniref:carbonic anhydrase IV c isoform X2 n=1 Tax=Puntigrus tetrazona TaxID=1606681 RepID=UPI001C8AF837|nr:carbonic anhydrase IV c isoform X2 [Puntigrus tetrazona]